MFRHNLYRIKSSNAPRIFLKKKTFFPNLKMGSPAGGHVISLVWVWYDAAGGSRKTERCPTHGWPLYLRPTHPTGAGDQDAGGKKTETLQGV